MRKSSLSPEFLEQFVPKSRETKFLGKPIHSLNRSELLAVAAYHINLFNEQANQSV